MDNVKEAKTINLHDVLALLDETESPDGSPIWHEIAFITYNKRKPQDSGRLVRIEKCHKTGLRGNVKELQRRGLVDTQGNVRNCHIRLIIEFDYKKVVW